MKLASTAAAAALVLGTLGVAGGASAAIVCNGSGVCWHTHGAAYTYQPAWGLTVHEDNWHWGRGEHYRFRDHAGRGYWAGNRWTTF